MTDTDVREVHSAGGVVLNRLGQVAVVRQQGGTWSLPKGHVDSDEGVLDAARREIYEECGISVLELVRELGSYSRPASRQGVPENKTITLFLFRTPEDVLAPRDPDNPEARWLPRESVAGALSHPADGRFFALHVLPVLVQG